MQSEAATETEDALRRSEARLTKAQTVARVGSWELNAETWEVAWSAEMFHLVGLDPKHGVPDYPGNLALFSPETAAPLDALVRRALNSGQHYALDLCRVTPKGTVQWFQAAGHAVKDERGRTVRLVGTLLDITDRKAAEDSLRRREADLSLALGAARLGTFSCEWPFGRVALNDLGRQHWGLPPDGETDLAGLYARLHPEDCRGAREAFAHALETQTEYAAEYRVPSPAGEARWISAIGRGVYGPGGVPLRFDGVTADITARRQADAAQAEAAARDALLHTFSAETRRALSADAVLDAAVTALGPALGADRCYWVAYDMEAQQALIGPDWHRPGLSAISGAYAMHDFPGNRDPAYLAGGTQAIADSLRLTPTGADPCLDLRALLRVPVSPAPRLFVLAAVMTAAPRSWTPAELRLAEEVAAEAQAALEALGAGEARQRLVSAWEKSVQPPLPGRLPGLSLGAALRPALQDAALGGDFCDVFALGGGRWAIVLGDVSGKGVLAASQVVPVRSMARFSLYKTPALAEAVADLNAVLTEHAVLAGFATLWAGVYTPDTGEIVCVSCGHEPALHRQAATGGTALLAATGPPLGVDRNAVFAETRLRLSPGDNFLVYTDGLAEAGPSYQSMLGTEGVVGLLRDAASAAGTQAAAAQIVRAAAAYNGGPFSDDVSVLLLRRE